MAEVVGETYVQVRPETAGFGAALSTQVDSQARRAGVAAGRSAGVGFSEGFRSTIKTGLVLVGITGAFDAVKDAVKESAGLAGEITLVENAATRASAANTLYGQSIEQLVTKQELQKGFTDEELYPSFSRLITATGDTEKAYKDLQLAEDVARQRHIDVTVAALALAKAEDGSVTSLQRLGIILPQHIRDLKGAEKATAAIAFTEQRFAGASQEFADSGAGALARFGAAFHVLRGAAGESLAPEIEKAANATADWASKSENLEKVQRNVATVGHVVEGGVKAIGIGLHVAVDAVGPFVDAVGGAEKATELVFGAIAVKKVQALTGAIVKWAVTTTAGETAVATATTAEAAATTAATAASVRQVAVYGARGEVLATVAVAEEGVAAAATASGLAAGGSAAKFASLGLSAGGAASVLKSGVAPAAVIAGYELSTFIRKIPGWNDEFESLGAHAESLAEKLGLVGKSGISKASVAAAAGLQDQSIQDKLIAAYKQAGQVTGNEGFQKKLRDEIVASLVGPGYTFNDARIFAQNQATRQRGQAGAAVRQNYDPNAAAAASAAANTPDLDYRIRLQEALATKTTADEREIYANQLKYVDARIAALKATGDLTASEKKRLLERENEQAALQQSITQIDQDTANRAEEATRKRQQAAEDAKQAYVASVSLQEQLLQIDTQRAALTVTNLNDDRAANQKLLAFYKTESQDAKLTAEQRAQYEQQYIAIEAQSIQASQAHYRDQLSIEETRLQLAAKRAELTSNSIVDDKAAARKLIAFYTRESHDAKLTEAERLQFTSQAIDERIALKNLSGQQQGATAQQIFAEAASEFHTYGSNISTRSGVLSGQDARASFAERILGSGGPMDIAARAAAQQRSSQLTEAQKQTALLAEIARTLGGSSPKKNVPPDFQSADARRVANLVGR